MIVEIKTALNGAGINMPFPVRTLDLSDTSVDVLVDKTHNQSDSKFKKHNTKSDNNKLITE